MQSKSNLKWGQIEYLFDIHISEFTRGLGETSMTRTWYKWKEFHKFPFLLSVWLKNLNPSGALKNCSPLIWYYYEDVEC